MLKSQTILNPEMLKQVINLPHNRNLQLSKPLVMGILNVTPDSFSDGGQFKNRDQALKQALCMIAEGADIIDIGGESSRPGASPVSPVEEQKRVLPIIEDLRQKSDCCLSIDTYHASTARAALACGVDIVNDISALNSDPDMVTFLAENENPVILMHMQGSPGNMQKNPHYNDCVGELIEFFDERIEFCNKNGIDRSRLILDPGIGFGKRLADNLNILSELSSFKDFGLPLLIGASRKSFIAEVSSNSERAENRLGGSIAAAIIAASNGADILRVHDVHPTVEALNVLNEIKAVDNRGK